LRRAGLKTVMMRGDDHFVELETCSFANRQPNAVLVSIHMTRSQSCDVRSGDLFWRADSHGWRRDSTATGCGDGRGGSGGDSTTLETHRNPEIPCIWVRRLRDKPGRSAEVATASYRQRIAHGIAQGILESTTSDSDSAGPEPYGPLSRPRTNTQSGVTAASPSTKTNLRSKGG
jgi:hypothetical protein